jgi:hypothetical protein
MIFATHARAEPPPLDAEPLASEPPDGSDPREVPASEPIRAGEAPLENTRRFELVFPIKPLSFSFSEARSVVPELWERAPYTFRAEALWFDRGGLSVRTIGASEAKLELDCLVTCRPLVEHSMTVEARMSLGSPARVVPDAHFYSRTRLLAPQGQSYTAARAATLLEFGIGGQLDL